MAKKISDLALVASVSALDAFEVVQAGVSRSVNLNLPWTFKTPTLGVVAGDTLTINAGTWTYGSNYSATRNVGVASPSAFNACQHIVTFTGDPGGASDVRGWNFTFDAQGTQPVVQAIGMSNNWKHSGSATLSNFYSMFNNNQVTGSGSITTHNGVFSQFSLDSTGNITNARCFVAGQAGLPSTGAITTHIGFQAGNLGHPTLVTNAIGFRAIDFTTSLTLTAAFEGQLVAGTNKWNLYMSGTAENYLGGPTSIGRASTNYWKFVGETTTNPVRVTAEGSDTNIGMNFGSKGANGFDFRTGGNSFVQFDITHTANALNNLRVSGEVAGAAPKLAAVGSDTNIGMLYDSKGNGSQVFRTHGGSSTQFRIRGDIASAVNFFFFFGGAAAQGVELRAEGTDTNINAFITTKGSGSFLFMSDTSTRTLLTLASAASSVNSVYISPAATGAGPLITSQGGDTNVDLRLGARGTGSIRLQTGSFVAEVEQVRIVHTVSAVNRIEMQGAATANALSIAAAGSDANIQFNIKSKGTGSMVLGTGGAANVQFYTNLGAGDSLQAQVLHVASAVNRLEFAGAATGNRPLIKVEGTDTNIGMSFQVKGQTLDASEFKFVNGSGGAMLEIDQDTGTLANSFIIRSSLTGVRPQIIAVGTDTNVGLRLLTKGSGDILLDGATGDVLMTGASIPINSQSAAYTMVAADANKCILHPAADNNARTFTIPANSSVAYKIGTAITFVNEINTLTIAITTDTMKLAGPGTTGSRTLAADGVATAIKIASTVWYISGTDLT